MRKKYVAKLKAVSILFTLLFFAGIACLISRLGILPMNSADAKTYEYNKNRINDDKVSYETIMGDVYDVNEEEIFSNNELIYKSKSEYNQAYSYLLGNISLEYEGVLNNSWDTLTDTGANDIVENKGYSIQLTIDDSLQKLCYSLTEGTRCSVVVLKRNSGNLVALTGTYKEGINLGTASLDSKLLEKYNSSDEPVWLPEYLNSYAPGSVYKIFMSALAYETETDDFTINDIGYVNYGERIISNFNGASYGNGLNLQTAFINSSNTYFSELAQRIPISTQRIYMNRFLFNSEIDTDVGKISSSVDFGGYSDYEIAQLGFGQGNNKISSICLAMMAEGVLDGKIYKPHVIKGICHRNEDGKLVNDRVTKEEILSDNTVSAETSQNVSELMYKTARSYDLSETIIGAKTGTAEIGESDGSDRGTMICFDENYIVVVSKLESGTFGIDNKEIVEKIFDRLEEIQSSQTAE